MVQTQDQGIHLVYSWRRVQRDKEREREREERERDKQTDRELHIFGTRVSYTWPFCLPSNKTKTDTTTQACTYACPHTLTERWGGRAREKEREREREERYRERRVRYIAIFNLELFPVHTEPTYIKTSFIYSAKKPQRGKAHLLTKCAPNASGQYYQSLHCLSKETLSKNVTKCAKWKFWSYCANAQSDLNLRWAHMSESTFCDVPSGSKFFPT